MGEELISSTIYPIFISSSSILLKSSINPGVENPADYEISPLILFLSDKGVKSVKIHRQICGENNLMQKIEEKVKEKNTRFTISSLSSFSVFCIKL